MLNTSTLRPGLLVSLKTSVRGNVNYSRKDIETGVEKATWETTRVISDPVEHERSRKVRSKASSLIRSVCAHSAFGLLCPEADADKLEEAMTEARKLVDDFNSEASLTRVGIYLITGRIAADDVEAMKAINSEVAELIEQMQDGVKNLNVDAIRDAAKRAKSVGQMLSDEAQFKVQKAIDAARKVAKDVVAAGEQAAVEIDRSALRTLKEARTAFLDVEEVERKPDAPRAKARARGVDLQPAAAKASKKPRAARQLEV